MDCVEPRHFVFAKNEELEETHRKEGGGRESEAEMQDDASCNIGGGGDATQGPKVNSPNVRAQAEYRCTVPFAASFPWVMVNYGCLISPALVYDYHLQEGKREREKANERGVPSLRSLVTVTTPG